MTVDGPVSASTAATLFRVKIHPDSSVELKGADCEVRFCRNLFPVNMWCIDGADTRSASVNLYNKNLELEPELLPSTPNDANMTASLAEQLRKTLSLFETMIPGMNCAQWLVNVARDDRERRTEVMGAQYTTDIDAIASTVALLTNQLLVSARWHMAHNEDTWVESSSVRWQMFGSGPRLP